MISFFYILYVYRHHCAVDKLILYEVIYMYICAYCSWGLVHTGCDVKGLVFGYIYEWPNLWLTITYQSDTQK